MKTLSLRNKIWMILVIFIFVFAWIPVLAQSEDSVLGIAFQAFVVELLLAIIAIAVPTLTAMVIQWLRKQSKLVESRLTSEQLFILQTLTATMVKAAEKSAFIGAIQDTAAAKKAFAVREVQSALRQRGLTELADNISEISNTIEAAVQDGIHKAGIEGMSFPAHVPIAQIIK